MLSVTKFSTGSVFVWLCMGVVMLFGGEQVMAHCGGCEGDHVEVASAKHGDHDGHGHGHSDKHDHEHAEHHEKSEKYEKCGTDCSCEKCEAKKAEKKDECGADCGGDQCDAKESAKADGDCGGDSCPLMGDDEAKSEKACGKDCSGATCTKCMPKVSEFAAVGELRQLTGFFDAASKEKKANGQLDHLVDTILVTDQGVYHFIENEDNQAALSSMTSGSVIEVKGKAYNHGGLLYVNSVKSVDKELATIDTSKYSQAKGQKVVLEGVNGCQCQLDVAELPHSCKLGHLHHLQDKNGRIFNYIPTEKSYNLIKGKQGTHGQKIKIEGLRLPGNSLLVTKVSK